MPDANASVVASTCKELAAGSKGRAIHIRRYFVRGADLLPCFDIPKSGAGELLAGVLPMFCMNTCERRQEVSLWGHGNRHDLFVHLTATKPSNAGVVPCPACDLLDQLPLEEPPYGFRTPCKKASFRFLRTTMQQLVTLCDATSSAR